MVELVSLIFLMDLSIILALKKAIKHVFKF